jgi:branched-chain amino acid transport system permease protein
MLLDQWIFALRDFDIGPFRLFGEDVGPLTIRIFGTGSVPVDQVDVPGVDSPEAMLVFLSVVFALLYLLVVAVRRSTLGQRLLAVKDSPAASATLGINTGLVRLAVFSLSAAMAGFGGALYGGTLGAVGAQSFAFAQSLPLLLLAVVGGVGTAAGALVAGVMMGGLPLLVDAAPWFENVNRVLPGTLGITIGRNPNGIAHSLREGLAPLRRRPVLVLATALALAGVVALRLADTIDGGVLALGLVAALAAGGLGAQALEARKGSARAPAGTAAERAVPLEWAGIVRPFTGEEVAMLDRELGLEPSARPALTGRGSAGQ